MLINKFTDKLDKSHFLWAAIIIGALLVSGWFLKIRIEFIKKNILKNQGILIQAVPDFNDKSLEQLQQAIRHSKAELTRLAGIFAPKEKWLKKDYDLSIYFVEQLGEVNQLLKTKSVQKQVNIPELEFKEKMPSESEAFYLLGQLYGLKEIISLGMDYNMEFKTINPLGLEEIAGLSQIKLAKSRMELSCPAQSLLEFILQLNDIIPRPSAESLSLKSQGSGFELNLTLSHILVDLNWKDTQEFYISGAGLKEGLPQEEQNLARILRGSNPFFAPREKEMPSSGKPQALAETEKPKPAARFLYRGIAILKSNEVVAIEDTLNQETVFLAQGGKIDNFILNNFSNVGAELKNLDNGQEIIIKRGE